MHTPGPWNVDPEAKEKDPSIIDISASDRIVVVSMYTTAEERANARLIAAAPELLALCKEVLEQHILPAVRARKLQDAIKKATGET